MTSDGLTISLDHVVIQVSDWERSSAFDRDVLGAQVVEHGAGIAYRFGEQQPTCRGTAWRRNRCASRAPEPDLDAADPGRAIFGPVITVRSSRTRRKALEWANGDPDGLAAASVRTEGRRPRRCGSRRRSVGCVWVNDAHGADRAEIPHVGYQQSELEALLGLRLRGLDIQHAVLEPHVQLGQAAQSPFA